MVSLETLLLTTAMILMAAEIGRLKAKVADLESYTSDLDNHLDYHIDHTNSGFTGVNDFIDTVDNEFAKVSEAIQHLDGKDKDSFQ